MSKLMFGGYASDIWPTFQLPLAGVLKIMLLFAYPESALALAETLPGTLEVIFPPPERRPTLPLIEGKPTIFYTAILRSVSHPGSQTRELRHNVFSGACIAAFSMPALSDRVVCLTLPLEFWETFVGMPTFGPFNALEDLTLTLEGDAKFQSELEPGLPRLSCSRLQPLVLTAAYQRESEQRTEEIAISDIATFALACLPEAKFPLILTLEGISLTWACNNFPEVFSASSCLIRRT